MKIKVSFAHNEVDLFEYEVEYASPLAGGEVIRFMDTLKKREASE